MPKFNTWMGLKHGTLFGVKVTVTTKEQVLKFINDRLDLKEKFYIVTPNPENILIAKDDWLLKKAILRSSLSVPDGIGLAQAFKFLTLSEHKDSIFRPIYIFCQGLAVGMSTFVNKRYLTDVLEVIKGRELFLDVIKILNERSLKVYLFGGENGEQEKAKEVLEKTYKNITFKTHHYSPMYNRNGQPATVADRKIHKGIVGSIKLFEPDFIFVALNTPKQEKWIYRNIYRIHTTGAMAVGGTFNYIAGNMKYPPVWMTRFGLEWVYRLIQEPKRIKRIINAVIVFPWEIFLVKLFKKKFKS